MAVVRWVRLRLLLVALALLAGARRGEAFEMCMREDYFHELELGE